MIMVYSKTNPHFNKYYLSNSYTNYSFYYINYLIRILLQMIQKDYSIQTDQGNDE